MIGIKPYLLPMTLVHYGPTFPTPYVLQLWYVSSANRNETNGMMRSITRPLRRRTTLTTCAIVVDYRQRRRDGRSLIRRKTREQERREREEIEMYRSINDFQKFFKNIEGFKPGAGNLLTDA